MLCNSPALLLYIGKSTINTYATVNRYYRLYLDGGQYHVGTLVV